MFAPPAPNPGTADTCRKPCPPPSADAAPPPAPAPCQPAGKGDESPLLEAPPEAEACPSAVCAPDGIRVFATARITAGLRRGVTPAAPSPPSPRAAPAPESPGSVPVHETPAPPATLEAEAEAGEAEVPRAIDAGPVLSARELPPLPPSAANARRRAQAPACAPSSSRSNPPATYSPYCPTSPNAESLDCAFTPFTCTDAASAPPSPRSLRSSPVPPDGVRPSVSPCRSSAVGIGRLPFVSVSGIAGTLAVALGR